MEILLILSGFIFACLVALLYECKIRQMRKEPRNKVRFFVQKSNNIRALYLYNAKTRTHYKIAYGGFLKEFGLNPEDFADMKEGEIREVFLNLEE